MRFIQEADEIPQELIEAQDTGQLVIFAGAGVSMNPPSNLPSFDKLADDITKDLELCRNENEGIDRFLGKIADNYSNEQYFLHKRTVEFIKTNSQFNNLHTNILKLFNNNIRIVTTNFDNLFNAAARENKINIKSYYAPALPFGDDFEGIVYLHGCIDDKPENLVLTDKDFSQAYLCRGWASEFIKRLFDKYYVLFIGYSYNDIILNYLTRGLIPKNAYAIINEKEKDKWSPLRINAITYQNKNNKHKNLQNLIEQWVKYTLTDKLQEKSKIENIAALSPKFLDEISLSYIRDHIFKHQHTVTLFLKAIQKKYKFEWLLFIISNINLYDNNIYEKFHWMHSWIIDNCIEDEVLYEDSKYNCIIDYLKNNKQNNFLQKFRWLLTYHFSEKIINKKTFNFWLIYLIDNNQAERENGLLTLILKNCIKDGYKLETQILIRYLLFFKIDENEYDNKIIHNAHNYYLQEKIIKKYSNRLIEYYDTILQTMESCFLKVSELYKLKRNREDDFLFLNHYIDDISNFSEQEDNLSDIINIFYITKLSIDKLINTDSELAVSYIYRWISSDSYILNRFALYVLTQKQLISFDNIIEILRNKNWYSEGYFYSKEVMDYFKYIYSSLPKTKKEKFINILISENIPGNHIKYTILNYIEDKQHNDKVINKFKKELLKVIDIQDRKYLEKRVLFPHNELAVGTIQYDCEYNLKDILKNKITADIIQILKNAEAVEIIGNYKFPGKHKAFLDVLYTEIRKEYFLGINLLECLIENSEFSTDLYISIFRGLSYTADNISQENINKIINMIYNNYAEFKNEEIYEYILHFFENTIDRANRKEIIISSNLNAIKIILEFIWNISNDNEKISYDIFLQARNNIYGRILVIYINLFWLEYDNNNKDLNVLKPYYELFETKISDKDTFKSKIALSIIISNLFFLYSFDKNWTKNILILKLDIKNKDSSIAWNSIFYTNPRLSEDIINDILPYFNKLIEQNSMHIINDDLIENFCKFY